MRDWIAYPGMFAADRLDEGTALLLGGLPPFRPVPACSTMVADRA